MIGIDWHVSFLTQKKKKKKNHPACGMVTSGGYIRGGPTGRGTVSLALPGGSALSLEPARAKQPRQSTQASNQAHLV